jgi:hypothetical protein
MSDVETRLKELLHESVPPPGRESADLVAGARRYAARARRWRIGTTAAALAVMVGVGGAVASGAFRDRALTPAHPVDHLTCAHSAQARPAPTTAETSPLSARVKEVLVCADRSNASVWQGSLPPDEAISVPDSIDYLSFETTPSRSCPALPSGPSYRMLLLDKAGAVTYYDNRALTCNGWTALDRYWIALGVQVRTASDIQLADPFPKCPTVLHQQTTAHSGSPAALRKGTVFTDATACWYPLADPTRTTGLTVPARSVLSKTQLAALNAQVARTGSVKGSAPCQPDPTQMFVLRAVAADGLEYTITWACPHPEVGWVNWAADDTVHWDHAVIADFFS